MRQLVCVLLLVMVLLAASGCGTYYVTPVIPPVGLVYADFSAPLTTDFDNTRVSQREGSATSLFVLVPLMPSLSFSWDKADLSTAMQNGGLSEVDYADYNITHVLGIFARFTVTAYGR